jgi:hypothetical protein
MERGLVSVAEPQSGTRCPAGRKPNSSKGKLGSRGIPYHMTGASIKFRF